MQSHMSLALNVLDEGLKVRLDSAFSALNKSLQSVMSVYNYLQYFPTYCRGWHNEWKSGGAEICDLPFLQYMPHIVANWPSTIFPPGEILISRINWETDSLSKCQRLVFLHRSITANMHVLCRLWIHYIILLITNLTQQDFLILNTCCFFDTSPTSWKCSHVKTWPLPWNVIYNFCIYRSRSMEWELEAKDCISELFTDGKWIAALLKYSLICVKRPEYHLLSYIDKNLL